MRIIMPCRACFDKGQQSWNTNRYEIEINEEGLYRFTCKNGHDNQFVLGNPKFEILYESGLYALADGYYREACTSLYVALERFFEFMLLAQTVWYGTVDSYKSFTAYFKFMAKQSERQLGAFYVLLYPHSQVLNDKSYNESIVAERNRFIHQGFIPSEEQAIAFAENIKRIIDSVWDGFHKGGGPLERALTFYKDHLREITKLTRPARRIST